VLERNLTSGSNEYHKNTSGSVAGLRSRNFEPGASRNTKPRCCPFETFFLSSLYQHSHCRIFINCCLPIFRAIAGVNIANQPTARNVDNVKNLRILAQLHNFHNTSTFSHSCYCALFFVYFVEGEGRRSPWLCYFDPPFTIPSTQLNA